MARIDSAVLPHEETAPAQEEFLHPEMDGRFANLDEEDGTPFLRKQKRVPARRGPLPKKATSALKWLALFVCMFTALGIDPQTVRSMHHKALTRLRGHFAPEAQPDTQPDAHPGRPPDGPDGDA